MAGVGIELGHQTGVDKLFDGAVQRAGADTKRPVGTLFDLLHDGVTVAIALAEATRI